MKKPRDAKRRRKLVTEALKKRNNVDFCSPGAHIGFQTVAAFVLVLGPDL